MNITERKAEDDAKKTILCFIARWRYDMKQGYGSIDNLAMVADAFEAILTLCDNRKLK